MVATQYSGCGREYDEDDCRWFVVSVTTSVHPPVKRRKFFKSPSATLQPRVKFPGRASPAVVQLERPSRTRTLLRLFPHFD